MRLVEKRLIIRKKVPFFEKRKAKKYGIDPNADAEGKIHSV